MLTEVLVQQTRAESVERFLPDFISRYPNWKSLALAKETELQQSLRRLGLWRRRASNLSRLAKAITKSRGRWPKERENLEEMPAVGQYVASAILLFVHGSPEPLLDGNMSRILERYFRKRDLADIRYDPFLQRISRRIVKGRDPKSINWAVLDFGALICASRNPKCVTCPLKKGCNYFAERR